VEKFRINGIVVVDAIAGSSVIIEDFLENAQVFPERLQVKKLNFSTQNLIEALCCVALLSSSAESASVRDILCWVFRPDHCESHNFVDLTFQAIGAGSPDQATQLF